MTAPLPPALASSRVSSAVATPLPRARGPLAGLDQGDLQAPAPVVAAPPPLVVVAVGVATPMMSVEHRPAVGCAVVLSVPRAADASPRGGCVALPFLRRPTAVGGLWSLVRETEGPCQVPNLGHRSVAPLLPCVLVPFAGAPVVLGVVAA